MNRKHLARALKNYILLSGINTFGSLWIFETLAKKINPSVPMIIYILPALILASIIQLKVIHKIPLITLKKQILPRSE